MTMVLKTGNDYFSITNFIKRSNLSYLWNKWIKDIFRVGHTYVLHKNTSEQMFLFEGYEFEI